MFVWHISTHLSRRNREKKYIAQNIDLDIYHYYLAFRQTHTRPHLSSVLLLSPVFVHFYFCFVFLLICVGCSGSLLDSFCFLNQLSCLPFVVLVISLLSFDFLLYFQKYSLLCFVCYYCCYCLLYFLVHLLFVY